MAVDEEMEGKGVSISPCQPLLASTAGISSITGCEAQLDTGRGGPGMLMAEEEDLMGAQVVRNWWSGEKSGRLGASYIEGETNCWQGWG